jgi:hypothetical protein
MVSVMLLLRMLAKYNPVAGYAIPQRVPRRRADIDVNLGQRMFVLRARFA